MGEKSYECDICDKTFIKNSTLTVQNCAGEKPYECVACKMTFSSSGSLNVNKKVHTGEKPFSCYVCQKSYTHKTASNMHNKTTAHITRMKSKNTNILISQPSFVDHNEFIKVELKEEEIVDDQDVSNIFKDVSLMDDGSEVNKKVLLEVNQMFKDPIYQKHFHVVYATLYLIEDCS